MILAETISDSLFDLYRSKKKESYERILSEFLYEGINIVTNSYDTANLIESVLDHLKKFISFEEAFLYKNEKFNTQYSRLKCIYKSSSLGPDRFESEFIPYIQKKEVINIYKISPEHPLSHFRGFVGGACLAAEIAVEKESYILFLFSQKTSRFKLADKKVLKRYCNVIGQAIFTKLVFAQRIKAENSSRLKSLYLVNMSHELRTPVGSIKGFAELLKRESLSRAESRQFVDIISRSSDHLLKVIDDILDISKIESRQLKVEIEKVDIRQFMKDLRLMLTKRCEAKGIELKVNISEDLPKYVYTDPLRLHQILLNLLNNAIKFTDKGEIILKGYLRQGLICFEVKDTGVGIKKENQDDIFNRFYQCHPTDQREKGGAGLGLSISRELARLLGGEVTLKESQVNHGTCFLVYIRNNEKKQKESFPKIYRQQSKPQNISASGTVDK